jgi:ubiquinone biosynthesis protein UbiJ
MLHSLNAMLAPALMERIVLVVNHVLGAEPAATQRLQAHGQRIIELQMQGWPSLLPAPSTWLTTRTMRSIKAGASMAFKLCSIARL